MKTEHTPGPWTVTFGIDGAVIHNEVTIAKVNIDAIAWKTNARLMAAAPELLKALEGALVAVRYLDDHEGAEELMNQVCKAIIKAKGGVK